MNFGALFEDFGYKKWDLHTPNAEMYKEAGVIEIKLGDARHLDNILDPESVALSIWSPP